MYRKIVTPPREDKGGLTLAAQNAVNAIANDLGAGPAYYSPIPAINPAFVQPDGNSYPTVFGRYNHQLQAADPQKFGNRVNGTSNGHRPPPPSGPFAIFTPCSSSHPFEERTVQVSRGKDHAIKIGRAGDRFQPAPNNAIFECKSVSRDHAMIWYEDDKFFIQTTESFNGTFVNNSRLPKSQPKLLRSGEILQLGAKDADGGCITCILRLVDERGEECLGPPEENPLSARMPHAFGESVPHNCSLISNEKLFVMSQYMEEAKHREKLLTEQLRSLESLLEMTTRAAEFGSWALNKEEQLLTRIEILESQLTCAKEAASKNSEETLERVNAMLEYHGKAEDELRTKLIAHQEKICEAEMMAEYFKEELIRQKKIVQLYMGIGSSQPAVETTPTIDEQPNVDVLFISVFPLAIVPGFFLELLFRWLPGRVSAAVEPPEAEDRDRLKKDS
ncbi:FHA domain-containing protein [Aphelenchoides fujianensis]|nr:FHA domain-containing protein [Aphelenchoides fujianensis]